MNSPAKILVVDDTPRNVKLLADLLSVKGYAVVTASSGQEALTKIDAEPPDLVLFDVVMPEMSGYEVCQKIRENPATAMLPVIMVTALDPAEERVKGIEAGADDFLTKPINQGELLARVKSLLRIKELHDIVQVASRRAICRMEQELGIACSRTGGTTGTIGTVETILFTATGRIDRQRRRRRSAEDAPAAS